MMAGRDERAMKGRRFDVPPVHRAFIFRI